MRLVHVSTNKIKPINSHVDRHIDSHSTRGRVQPSAFDLYQLIVYMKYSLCERSRSNSKQWRTWFDVLHSDVREVFDLFDFWDGRDGLVDGAKIGDVMRCIGLNPTNQQILDNGGTKKFGK